MSSDRFGFFTLRRPSDKKREPALTPIRTNKIGYPNRMRELMATRVRVVGRPFPYGFPMLRQLIIPCEVGCPIATLARYAACAGSRRRSVSRWPWPGLGRKGPGSG